MKQSYFNKGFSNVFLINIKDKLDQLQRIVYDLTKEFLIDHDNTIDILERLNLPFKATPGNKLWSEVMNQINQTKELNNVINDKEIIKAFKTIFKEPKRFPICFFRARFPSQQRVLYDWHQDEGTWYLNNQNDITKKYPSTLWFSINGSNQNNSIQLIEKSQNGKLYDHSYVEGQGYFKAKFDHTKIQDSSIHTITTKPSEGILFHPLTLHRSVPAISGDLKPRYSIDIRYYDSAAQIKIKAAWNFKIKKIYKAFKS